MNNFQEIMSDINDIPTISDHDHHLPDTFFAENVTLEKLIQNTYIAWMGYSSESNSDWQSKLLMEGRFNSYFTWFEKGIQIAHDIDLELTNDNWNSISNIVKGHYQADPYFHIESLRTNGFLKMILDCYWDPGSDNGHGELFLPTFRIDKFIYGFHSESVAPDDIIPWKKYNFSGNKLDDYVVNMFEIIKSQWQEGRVAALKCAEAYNRDINFLPDDESLANEAFGIHPNKITQEQRIVFGNYIFNRCCELAAELEIPFQIHTGLGRLSGSNPLILEPIIEKYPNTRFVLFHSGFPWTLEVAALSHNHSNVLPSLTWTATISPVVAARTLDEYIDVARSIDMITWGSDCWVPEESIGAMLAWKHIIAMVLAKRLNEKRLRVGDVGKIARKLLYENNQKVYSLADSI